MTGPAVEAVLLGADLVLTFVLLKATLVVLAAGLAVAVLARGAPALRAAIWTCAFGALMVAPAAALCAPTWTAQVIAFPAGLWRVTVAGAPAAPESGALPVAVWLFLLWFIVAAVQLIRIARDVAAARALLRSAVPPADTRLAALLDDARRRLGLRRSVRIALNPALDGPVSLGWLRPIVMLPAGAAAWPADRLRAVLLHEVAHARRGDWPVMIAVRIVRALHWFNPLIAWMARQVAADQDRACDLAAIRKGGIRPVDYARHLVDVARTLCPGGRPPLAALPLIGRSDLEGRVRAALLPGRSGSLVGVLTAALLAALLAVGIGGAQLWRCDASETAPAAATHTTLS